MDELNLMNLLLFLASQNSTGGSGGGGTSVYISNCSIDENGDLIVTLSDGTVMNAGKNVRVKMVLMVLMVSHQL